MGAAKEVKMWIIRKSKGLLIPLILLAIWHIGSVLEAWNPYIIPSPAKVMQTTLHLLEGGSLINHVMVSLNRVFVGFFFAFFLAFPLGVLVGRIGKLLDYLEPILEFVRHIPPLATVPMLVLLFGIGEAPKLVIIVMATFFPVFLNTLNGVVHCDPKLLEVGQSYGFSSRDKFLMIILPSSLPHILMGMRIGLGYSWRALIGAELIAAFSGIGYMILDAQQLSRPDVIIVGILTIGILGTIIDFLFFKLAHYFTPWKDLKEVQHGWG